MRTVITPTAMLNTAKALADVNGHISSPYGLIRTVWRVVEMYSAVITITTSADATKNAVFEYRMVGGLVYVNARDRMSTHAA